MKIFTVTGMTAIVVAIVRAISLASLQARERRSKHDGDPFGNIAPPKPE